MMTAGGFGRGVAETETPSGQVALAARFAMAGGVPNPPAAIGRNTSTEGGLALVDASDTPASCYMEKAMKTLMLAAAAAITLGIAGSSHAADQTSGANLPQAPSSTTLPQSAAAPINASEDQIKQVQQQLKTSGLYTGEVDGKLGPETKQALQQFQQQAGLQATGNLDQQTFSMLQNDSVRAGTSTAPGTPPSSAAGGYGAPQR
jgi:hypothetical protein